MVAIIQHDCELDNCKTMCVASTMVSAPPVDRRWWLL